jgi:3-oxoacid CoA-transferase B subunit
MIGSSYVDRQVVAARVVQYLRVGQTVNLGVGIPTLVADHLADRETVFLHTENGLLGVGPAPGIHDVDPNLVNASKVAVTARAGASFFSSAESFAMIRGGHIDVAVLGALQVDARGRIASWAMPGQAILGVGGAMDLLVGARLVIVATTHCARDGSPKIVPECTYPLTGERPVDLIVTERATFAVEDHALVLIEREPGTSREWIRANTAAPYEVRERLTV